MSKAQHTPGPWQLESDTVVLFVLGPRYPVALAYGDPRKDYVERNLEASANAGLIALTPDLLACVEELLEWLDQFEGESRVPADVYNRAWNLVQKARGESTP